MSAPSSIIKRGLDDQEAPQSPKSSPKILTNVDDQGAIKEPKHAPNIKQDVSGPEATKSASPTPNKKRCLGIYEPVESLGLPSTRLRGLDYQGASKLLKPSSKRSRSVDTQGTRKLAKFSLKRSKSVDCQAVPISFSPLLNIKRTLDHQDVTEPSEASPKHQKTLDSLESPESSRKSPNTSTRTILHETMAPVKLLPDNRITFVEKEPARATRTGLEKTAVEELRELAGSIPTSLDYFGKIRSIGFVNPAVLCYRISAIQLLMHTPKFISWLKLFHTPTQCLTGKPKGECITCILRDLAASYWVESASSDLHGCIMNSLDRIFNDLLWQCGGDNGQGDPDDQLRWMLNRMEEEISPAAYKALTSFSTLILDSSMKCNLCGDISKKLDTHEGLLSINLHPKPRPDSRRFVHLPQFLEMYFNGEVISGHRCEKCNVKSDKRRIQRITHAPDALTIQFKRFGWDGRKDSMLIAYPAVIDLTPYLASGTAKYALNGVITHLGKTTTAGHYRTIVKQPNSGKWSLLDDRRVSSSSIEVACEPTLKNKSQIPYIITYTKITGGKE